MISDGSQIPATTVSLGNSFYFCTWTRQKSVPVEKSISKGLENACRLFFDWKMHFANDLFSEFCFLPTRGPQFCKTASTIFAQKFTFFDPQVASKKVFFGTLFVHVALLAVPIAIVSHLEPFQIMHLAYDLCNFSIRSPVTKNSRMHHTGNFVNFVAVGASFSFWFPF